METHEEQGLSLGELISIILRKWLFIGIVTILTGALAAFYAFNVTPKYESKVSIMVQVPSSTTETGFNLTDAKNLIGTVEEFIKSEIVINRLKQDLNLNQIETKTIKNGLKTTAGNSSYFVYVTYESTDPDLAKTITNGIIDAARAVAGDGSLEILKDKIVRTSTAETGVYVSPNKTLYVIIGILLGGIVGVGIVLLLELTNNTYRDKDQLEKELNHQVLGSIPDFDVKEEN
ncbi:MAG TPA: Wzz/FepE/Etk N-terminal domain-containing protein [Acholeplasma sp.]|nr:Wzz/FepE/Etk N-terminal domain-containing protein [Acholeplasma sp.]